MGLLERAKRKALNGDHILSIYFHKPSKEEFESMVLWLKQSGFQFISVEDLKEVIYQGRPFPKGAVLITVDDGWASNVENMAALAEKHAVPITIFLATEAVENGQFWFSVAKRAARHNLGFPSSKEMKKLDNKERLKLYRQIMEKVPSQREAMTVEEIKQINLSNYVHLGAHTHSHPILPKCTDQEVNEEIALSKDKVATWTGSEVDTFAYPNGDFGSRECEALRSAGFKLAFTTHATLLTREKLEKPLQLPRLGFLEGASWEENLCRVMGIWYSKSTFKN